VDMVSPEFCGISEFNRSASSASMACQCARAVSLRKRLSSPVVGSALLAMADQGVDSLLERRMGHEQAPEAGPG